MKPFNKKAIIILPLFLFCTTNSETILLRLKLHEGQVFRSKTITKQIVEQESKGQKSNTEVNMENWATIKFLKVLNGKGYLIQFTMDSTKFENQNTNNQNPIDKRFTEILSEALRDIGFQLSIDSCWYVFDVSGFEKLKEVALSNVITELDLPTEKIKPIIDNYYDKQFSKEAVKKMFKDVSAIYPINPVTINQEWKDKTAFEHPIIAATKYSIYSISKSADGNLRIYFKAEIKKDKKTEPAKINKLCTQRNLIEGTMSGYMVMDSKTCWATDMIAESDMTFTIEQTDTNNNKTKTKARTKGTVVKETIK